jgi:glycosyltransferase involved in cell wall biosynthesis
VNTLIQPLDHIEWDTRDLDEVARMSEAALWLRCANFFDRSLDLLRTLEAPRLVLWRLEFWGTDTPFDQFPTSAGVDPARYAEEMLGLGHRVVPYTYTEWNRRHLVDRIPALANLQIHVLPIAKKPPAPVKPGTVRRQFGIPPADTVFGTGGLLHPAKGIDEIVGGFLRSRGDTRTHLLCSVIPDEAETTADDIRRTWRRSYGDVGMEVGMERVHIRVGDYGEWPWMCAFYEAVDVLLVNSVSDSWGRMVSEASGAGVPVLVRRTGCSTNHIAPGITLVDGFHDLDAPAFAQAMAVARVRAPGLAAYVQRRYSTPIVRRLFLKLLQEKTPYALRRHFDDLAHDPASLACLDGMVVY